jgi:hypothetical protein
VVGDVNCKTNTLIMNVENELNNAELGRSLYKSVSEWVERTFNYVQLEVVVKWSDENLFDYIRNKSVEDSFEDWLIDRSDDMELIKSFLEQSDDLLSIDELENKIAEYNDFNGGIEKSFTAVFGDDGWEDFKTWAIEENESDIQEYIYEQENYPMWNTLFEFRDSFYNQEEDVQKCLAVGLGVIEGLEPFNNMVFMTSAGHSFYSAYWIPLYLSLYDTEREKYKGVNYSHL